jgi:hypothetical protein
MEKTLSKEVKFGKAKAVVTVKMFNPMANLDGDVFQSERVEKNVTIEIVVNGKVVEKAGHVTLIEDCDYHRETMIQNKMDLKKKYSRVGKTTTEGSEACENIKTTIAELEAELVAEFTVKTEKEMAIEEAEVVIAQAQKEGIENLMTAAEIKVWKHRYNQVNNEGGEGYIPIKVSREEYERAVKVLGLKNVV